MFMENLVRLIFSVILEYRLQIQNGFILDKNYDLILYFFDIYKTFTNLNEHRSSIDYKLKHKTLISPIF